MQRQVLATLFTLLTVCTAACGGDEAKSSSTGTGGTPAATTGGAPAATTGGAPAATTGGAPAAGTVATPDAACLATFKSQGQSEACSACACSMCVAEATAFDVLAADVKAKAQAIIDCGRANCCAGTACYCGAKDATGAADLATCAAAMPPTGPCVAEIEAGAGAPGLAGIAGPCADKTNACGAASALGACLTGNPTSTIVAKCPACAPTCM